MLQVVQQWLADADPAAKLMVGSWGKTVAAFKILKEMVLQGGGKGGGDGGGESLALPAGVAGPAVPGGLDRGTVDALQLQVTERPQQQLTAALPTSPPLAYSSHHPPPCCTAAAAGQRDRNLGRHAEQTERQASQRPRPDRDEWPARDRRGAAAAAGR